MSISLYPFLSAVDSSAVKNNSVKLFGILSTGTLAINLQDSSQKNNGHKGVSLSRKFKQWPDGLRGESIGVPFGKIILTINSLEGALVKLKH